MQILFVNFGLFFQSTCIVFTQLFSLILYPFSYKLYRQFISYTMRMWSQNLIALVELFAPSEYVLTFDKSCGPVQDILQSDDSNHITGLHLPERMIVIANHQIYADWIYIWGIAHLAGAHGAVKIILKKSLEYLPIYGTGMKFFDFIFLKRKLAFDKNNIINNLQRSKRHHLPMWLVLFPEGTVISDCTRKKSKEYAEKNNMKDNRYTLLPRSTGLRLCTTVLEDSIEYVYDFTIGYSGIKPNEIPENVFTIQSIFFFNQYPKQIHIHIRRYRVDSIPYHNEQEFNQWTFDRWAEKDQLMDTFYRTSSFDDNSVTVPIKLKTSIVELAQIWIFMVPYLFLLKFSTQLKYAICNLFK
ncbi:uncharacterized protein RHIMIDRAFT_198584 [Rhizopus microsporus ATCC 52813]|uniref:Phospholipid/glycerol acyltransferase domain-containing protein n=1 Tax=Rhizopus microsporus ATCC 52813 TaxID=1340429 RepID=A0A2G4T442_RHIZD|nr:uncharacterized protein RHIMIDRAFT_198584 [Rhizopus microsporus ATCC 52813]PHZ15791.1 hypothetical protein RHIMIDRAFT_198584 [Rhizopus microsporus ATCC 52813]